MISKWCLANASASAYFYPKNTFNLADTWNNVKMMRVANFHIFENEQFLIIIFEV